MAFLHFNKNHNSYTKFSVTWPIFCIPASLAIMSFIAPNVLLNYSAFKNYGLGYPDEGYSRSASCALNLISTFLLRPSILFHRTHITHTCMTIFMSWINILCIKSKMKCCNNVTHRVKIGILCMCGKHLHDHIMSLSEEKCRVLQWHCTGQ